MTTDEYLALITTEHQERPRFKATVEATVAPFSKVQQVLRSMVPAYDVDTAVGQQLDRVALWIGVTRRIAIPIDGYYFTWDDVASDGWDNGVWKGIGDPDAGFVDLPDDLFRILIQSKILANQWRGDIPGAYEILAVAFGVGSSITITDNQNMTMTVNIAAGSIPAAKKALLTGGYIPIRPAGVLANYVTV